MSNATAGVVVIFRRNQATSFPAYSGHLGLADRLLESVAYRYLAGFQPRRAKRLSVGWFEAMTLMALETGEPLYRVAALEWGDLDFETHQLRQARSGWKVMSPELELHLSALPAGQGGRKVFNQADLQVHKAWARMFIKAGLVPVHLLQRGSQDLPTQASRNGETPADQQQPAHVEWH